MKTLDAIARYLQGELDIHSLANEYMTPKPLRKGDLDSDLWLAFHRIVHVEYWNEGRNEEQVRAALACLVNFMPSGNGFTVSYPTTSFGCLWSTSNLNGCAVYIQEPLREGQKP